MNAISYNFIWAKNYVNYKILGSYKRVKTEIEFTKKNKNIINRGSTKQYN